jgi:trigger factor
MNDDVSEGQLKMNVTETSSEGLKREFRVVVDKAEIERQVSAKLGEISKRVKLPGFRPGKIPMPLLKQRYGASVMGEVLEKTVSDTSGKAVADQGLRPAMRPKIDITSFDEGGDLEYTMAVEVLPEIGEIKLKGITLDKPVFAVGETDLDEALAKIAERHKSSEPVKTKRAAKAGDILVIDFKGTVDGVSRPGMSDEGYELELGSQSFIDTFEQQLIGAKPGEHRSVTVTFPQDYGAAELAGKEAIFEVDVKELKKAIPATLDDELAKKMGLDSFDKLKDAVRSQLQGEFEGYTKLKLKRALLDHLAATYKFPVPQGMVDLEFDAIWKRVEEEMKNDDGETEKGKNKGKNEKKLKAEYRDIAERRVRLGLLLSEIGRAQNLQVTQEELNRALIAEARRYPGQERQIIEFYRKTPHAIENLRAPLYEDKVVTYVLGEVTLKEKPVSKEELIRLDEGDSEA